jgi:CubicO group peptidase (beta-lactamase class C family)
MYPINLNKTLEELNINDKLGLSKTEKSATIKDLLMARSGIYHPASNGGDDLNKPERHSKKPGEYFVYNNWDFNALGTIFEKETGLTIYDALNDLGKKIKFEDYDLEFNKKEYKDEINREKDTTLSIHPPYHMYLSARDMLKIGKLMINKGEYDGKQVVPKEWIDEITYLHSHTRAEKNRKLEGGYGYMWWISDVNKDEQLHGAYSALGNKGQRIIVVPKLNLIIVTKNYQNGALLLPKILGMFS